MRLIGKEAGGRGVKLVVRMMRLSLLMRVNYYDRLQSAWKMIGVHRGSGW